MCAYINRLLQTDVNKYLTQAADWPIQGNYLWQKAFSEKKSKKKLCTNQVKLFFFKIQQGR